MIPPLLVLAFLAASYIVHLAISLFSPLRRVPGPFLNRLTSLVLKYHEFTANRTKYIHALHLAYGPVVRIAPNEVTFTSLAAVKEIYCSGGSGYDKTEFYNLFAVYGKRFGAILFPRRGLVLGLHEMS